VLMRWENKRSGRFSRVLVMLITERKRRQLDVLAKVLKPTPVASDHHRSVAGNPLGHIFGMPVYLTKPKEPIVLSHKEYHEISSTNLLLPLVVRLPLPNDTP